MNPRPAALTRTLRLALALGVAIFGTWQGVPAESQESSPSASVGNVVLSSPLDDQPEFERGAVLVKMKRHGAHGSLQCWHCAWKQQRAMTAHVTADHTTGLGQVLRALGAQDIKATRCYGKQLTQADVKFEQRTARWRAKRGLLRAGAQAETQEEESSGMHNWVKIELPDTLNPLEAAALLTQLGYAKTAQPNYAAKILVAPNDQHYGQLWGLRKIKAEQAWVQSQGEGIIVGVVDTGIDYTHPDLAANLWINDCEDLNHNGRVDSNEFNGVDDACAGETPNGKIDDLRGWDFTTCATFNKQTGECILPKQADNDPMDDEGHGTHVSGTIAAVGNNGIGIIGVAPKVTLMSAKAFNFQGFGHLDDMANAILYLAENGADVINNSWSTCAAPCRDDYSEDAVREAINEFGIVVVFAAGNGYRASADDLSPNNMTDPKPIVVSATCPSFLPGVTGRDGQLVCTAEDAPASFSNLGTVVDVGAPGAKIFSTVPDGGYEDNYGTSMAAPHVSGVAALLLSKNPDLAVEEVRDIIRRTADPVLPAGYGEGILNAEAAVAEAANGNRSPVLNPIGDKEVAAGATLRFTVNATDPDNDPLTFSVEPMPLPAGASFINRTFTWTPTDEQIETYELTFRVSDGSASDVEAVTIDVLGVNHPPVIEPIGSKSAAVGQELTFTIHVTDPGELGEVTLTASNLAAGTTITPSAAPLTWIFRWTPTAQQVGTRQVTFTATDSHNLSDSETITITVGSAPPQCSCTEWMPAASCGGSSCASSKRAQTRQCAPSGCEAETRCVDDIACTTPPPPPGTDFSVTASTLAPTAGQVVRCDWSAPAGRSSKDWVGLFAKGAPNSDYSLGWHYTGAATTGSWSATPPGSGQYEFRYLLDDGYEDRARSQTIAVGAGSGGGGGGGTWSVVMTPTDGVEPGGELTVSFTVPAAEAATRDWIGIFKVTERPQDYAHRPWRYLDKASSGAKLFRAPNEPGDYIARIMSNDGFEEKARSNIVRVGPVLPGPVIEFFRATPSTMYVNEETTLSWASNAETCTVSGEYGTASGGPSDSVKVTLGVAKTHQFTLRCTKNNQHADAGPVSVVVQERPTSGVAVSGRVLLNGSGLPGVTITLNHVPTPPSAPLREPRQTVTGADGRYEFANTLNGTYRIVPAKANTQFAPTEHSITVSGQAVTNKDFLATIVPPGNGAISGRVTLDGNGLPGIEIVLAPQGRDPQPGDRLTDTDAAGQYGFTNVPNGSYVILPDDLNNTFEPDKRNATVASGPLANQDFAARPRGGGTQKPDLTITALTIPSSIAVGQTVSFRAMIKNQGQTASVAGADKVFEVWIDGVMAGSAFLPAISPGDEAVLSPVNWVATAGSASRNLWSKVDVKEAIDESNEANNVREAVFTVTGGGTDQKPDLIVTGVTHPSQLVNIQVLPLTATVKNQGQAVSSATQLELKINNAVVGTAPVPALAVGEQRDLPAINWTIVVGTHPLRATVDPANTVAESNETNNVRDQTLTIGGGGGGQKPDLTITALPIPGSIQFHQTVSFRATVKNQGQAAVSATTSLAFEVWIDGAMVGSAFIPAMSPNGEVTLAPVNWVATPGPHSLWSKVDAKEVLEESNEDNNVREATFTVTGGDPVGDVACRGGNSGGLGGGSSTMAGRIFAAGVGIPHVYVQLSRNGEPHAWGCSNILGPYNIFDLPSGAYTVTPQREGWCFYPSSQTVTVNGDTLAPDFQAGPSNGGACPSGTGQADYIVETLTPLSSALLSPGHDISLRSIVRNAGSGVAPVSQVRFLIDGAPVGNTFLLPIMAPNTGYSVGPAVWRTVAGPHTSKVEVDVTNAVPESNENNNSMQQQLTVSGN